MDRDAVEGGCLCGAVRFAARGTPYRVGLCHCMTCRKMTAAPFSGFAVFPVAAVALAGETRANASSAVGRRHFCIVCGTPAYFSEEGGDEVVLGLGCFDEPGRFTPTYELWIGRREPWLAPIPGARQYPRNRDGKGRGEPS